MRTEADNQRSIARYRAVAAGYDASAERTMALRRRTVALLALQPGEVVLDVGSGTGLSYGLLREAVGARGRVLAFEQSADMFAQAEARRRREGWIDIWHRRSSAESVELPQAADAVLFNYVHDVLRSPVALDNLLRQVKPGARIAVAGMKFFPWWTGPLNLLAWMKNRPYNARAADMWQPWDLLQARCGAFERQTTHWGMGYVAHGRLLER